MHLPQATHRVDTLARGGSGSREHGTGAPATSTERRKDRVPYERAISMIRGNRVSLRVVAIGDQVRARRRRGFVLHGGVANTAREPTARGRTTSSDALSAFSPAAIFNDRNGSGFRGQIERKLGRNGTREFLA